MISAYCWLITANFHNHWSFLALLIQKKKNCGSERKYSKLRLLCEFFLEQLSEHLVLLLWSSIIKSWKLFLIWNQNSEFCLDFCQFFFRPMYEFDMSWEQNKKMHLPKLSDSKDFISNLRMPNIKGKIFKKHSICENKESFYLFRWRGRIKWGEFCLESFWSQQCFNSNRCKNCKICDYFRCSEGPMINPVVCFFNGYSIGEA